MDGKDIELRLKQNIQFLRDRSGSGQVPPEYLCQLLEEMVYFLAQAYGQAKNADEAAQGVTARVQALERRLTPTVGSVGPFGGAGGGLGPPGSATGSSGRLP